MAAVAIGEGRLPRWNRGWADFAIVAYGYDG
jgi:hypothetical protein